MHLILIDNYDSFTYNLVQLFEELGARVDVRRNDRFALDELAAADALVLSPGPGIPSEAGLLLDTVRHYAGGCPSSASAWAIRPSAKSSVPDLKTWRTSTTACRPPSAP